VTLGKPGQRQQQSAGGEGQGAFALHTLRSPVVRPCPGHGKLRDARLMLKLAQGCDGSAPKPAQSFAEYQFMATSVVMKW
ncbi:hypothetical protein, partial [Pseudomonas viridiflava]|uniref:hypothetical protein n=1 Tax=Pseudomonas viridiflava TaxID=33069 RepID=UPI00197CD11D